MTTSPPSAPAVATTITLHTVTGVVTVQVDVANDEASRERGLMYKRSMPPDQGMLFLFADEAPRSFWMKNTYIPLDLIFIDARHQVVGVVQHAEPLTTTPRFIATPAQYVLEVNAGFAQRFRVDQDTLVSFTGLPQPRP